MAAIPIGSNPANFVTSLTMTGLPTIGGAVPLNQYLSSSPENGGNEAAVSLYGPLRYTKDATGKTMNTLIGIAPIDLALKGQGAPKTFSAIWDFMARNKVAVGKIPVKVISGKKPNQTTKTGTVEQLFSFNKNPSDALKRMVVSRFFGLDCIGFVANYLIWAGYWTSYKPLAINDWPNAFTEKVTSTAQIRPLTIMIWPGAHIAIIDSVISSTASAVAVNVCQSSSGGPQTNAFVVLSNTKTKGIKGMTMWKVEGGTPVMPVTANCYLINGSDLNMQTAADWLGQLFGGR